MNLFSGYKGDIRFWLKSYLFIGIAVLTLIAFLYSNHVIKRMQEQSAATTRLFSRFIAEVILQVDESGKREMLREVLGEMDLPIIFTDAEGRPIVWHRIGVPQPADEDFKMLLSIDPGNPPPGKIRSVIETMRKLDKKNEPVAVRVGFAGPVQGYIHFGSSRLQKELRFMPLIQLGIFLIFMAAGLQGFRYLKLSEQRSIWVGMAKETAHQLGTPLSALLGWAEILREKCEEGNLDSISQTIEEMKVDLDRLEKVTNRFGKIGSEPELSPIDLAPILERTVEYFRKRLPSLKPESCLKLDVGKLPTVQGNSDLLEWAFENLVKNGIDAIGEKGGEVEIQAEVEAAGHVDVYIKDTGRGIPAGHRQRIFSPGFTTKRRGWGLGLALTKRIVESYHNGELKLMESHPGRGTVFRVRLPVA